MTKEKSIRYKKAYTELNEIFKTLDKEQKDKIPKVFINNISNNMDKDYKFEFDSSKGIFEQDLMTETEALLVEIYERYLAPSEEKEMWQKYDRYCLNKIEEEKRINCNYDIFKKNENINKEISIINSPVEVKKEKFYEKIINFLKKIFHI